MISSRFRGVRTANASAVSAFAEAVDEDVDEAQGRRLPVACAVGIKDAEKRSKEVFGRDVGTDRARRDRAVQQQAGSRRELLEGVGFQLGRPMRDELQSLDQTLLGCDQANVGVQPVPQRLDGVAIEGELSGQLAEMVDLVTVDGLEQRLARWEMPIQRSYADARVSSDPLKASL